jgi:hypothetical protein
LFGSVFRSAQVAPHVAIPVAHLHTPPEQALFVPHGVVSGAVGFEHCPVTAVHVPGVWHESLARHDADEQQTLLTQLPVPHWAPPIHEEPSGMVETHEPEMQYGVAAAHIPLPVQVE